MMEENKIKDFFGAIEDKRYDDARELLSEEVEIKNFFGESCSKEEYVAFWESNRNAFSELTFNLSPVKFVDGNYEFTTRISATNTGEIHFPGMFPVEATGNSIELGRDEKQAVISEGKIVLLKSDNEGLREMEEIMRQVGVDPANKW